MIGSLSQTAATETSSRVDKQSIYSSIEDIGPSATTKWPDEYGWVWIEPGKPEDGVFVGFTEGAEEKVAELAEDFSHPDLLVPVTVKYSAKEIQELQNQVIAGRKAAKQGEGPLRDVSDGHFDLGADIEKGKVIVAMPEVTDEVKNTFRSVYGDDLRFVERELSGYACLNRRQCGKHLRAGIQARNKKPFHTWKCSTGYTVQVGASRQILSAAHCSISAPGVPPFRRFHGGTHPTKFGRVRKNVKSGAVDAERISVEGPFVAHPLVYRDHSHQTWPVTSLGTWGQIYRGQPLCRAGNTTGLRCGQVVHKNFSPESGGKLFIRTTACVKGGDSGGPFFHGHEAWGITAGYVPHTNPGCQGPNSYSGSYFGALSAALNHLNATLVYTP